MGLILLIGGAIAGMIGVCILIFIAYSISAIVAVSANNKKENGDYDIWTPFDPLYQWLVILGVGAFIGAYGTYCFRAY